METGYLNFHDEEHFSDFSLSLGQHNLLDDSQSSLLAIDDDFDYVEARLDTSGGLWGTEQELNGDMAVLPVSGVASVVPKIENMKEDFAKVLTDWQEHIGYLQASDMGEDIDMAELSMGIPEKLSAEDLPEDIFQNEMAEARVNAHSSPMKKRQRDFTNTRSPRSKKISETSSQDIDVIGLDSSEDLEPEFDLTHVDSDNASALSDDIDIELLAASRGNGKFDLASYITGDDDAIDAMSRSIGTNDIGESTQPDVDSHEICKIEKKNIDPPFVSPMKIEQPLPDANSDNEESVDVETVIEQMPVLQAGDVTSLLEQFEASEASAIVVRSVDRKSRETTNDCKSGAAASSEPPVKARPIDRTKQTRLVKSIETQDSKFHKNIRNSLPKEVIDRIKASARKKVISVIPALSSTKVGNRSTRMQEAAATLSRTKLLKIVANGASSSSGRADGSVQLDHDYCSNNSSVSSATVVNSEPTRNTSREVGIAEISSIRENSESRDYAAKPSGYYVPISKKKDENNSARAATTRRRESERSTMKICDRGWGGDCGSRKDSGLESGEVSDASEETVASILPFVGDNNRERRPKESAKREKAVASSLKNNDNTIGRVTSGVGKSRGKATTTTTTTTTTVATTTTTTKTTKTTKTNDETKTVAPRPIYEMKIRSALATSILQLRKGVLTKTKSLEAVALHGRSKPMISVLKKPRNSCLATNHPNESIVTTINSSNDEVRNIIVGQETMSKVTINRPTNCSIEAEEEEEEEDEEEDEDEENAAKKPIPRRKLNLAEYRSRREQTRSDNSRTCSPIQPMILVYIHHASTSTEPSKDDPDNPVWSEREIVSVLKPKADFEEEKNRERVATRDIAVQTGENTRNADNPPARSTAANSSNAGGDNIVGNVRGNSETRLTRTRERKNRRYRKRRASSSSTSRSRSRSPMNRDRGTSRGRNRSRSRSRRCRSSSNPRRRRISHRRSSVSSSSSSSGWSSRSRSRTRSSTRSRSRSLRSRSRSIGSRSRSRSSSRYSSCSRSSSRSNLGRSKWSGGDVRSKRRRVRHDPRTSCDRYRRGSSGSSHGYRGWRRSPRSSYRREYDGWYHKEKKRQMEERRVIYVGRLDENTTKVDLRRRFEAFGPVLDISVHFREHGDNYGFVTFAYKNDAYEAVEHGNDDPSLPRYDLSFGGRRAFCKVKYADLDGMAGNSLNNPVATTRSIIKSDEDNTFDLLLKEAKAKLRKRKV